MSFLSKNINLALVVVILVVVLLATATTVLYQQGLRERTSQYETTTGNLSQCMNALANYRDVLEVKTAKLNETSQDIRKYDILYSQKQSELSNAEEDLAATKKQLTSTLLQKEQYKEELGQKVLELEQKEQDVAQLNALVATLRDKIKDLEAELDSCGT